MVDPGSAHHIRAGRQWETISAYCRAGQLIYVFDSGHAGTRTGADRQTNDIPTQPLANYGNKGGTSCRFDQPEFPYAPRPYWVHWGPLLGVSAAKASQTQFHGLPQLGVPP